MKNTIGLGTLIFWIQDRRLTILIRCLQLDFKVYEFEDTDDLNRVPAYARWVHSLSIFRTTGTLA